MILPSTQETAENIKKHIDGMAVEIGKRVMHSTGGLAAAAATVAARDVLTEWFLGEWLPPPPGAGPASGSV